MSLKLFFLTTEIEPFASTSHLGKFSVVQLPMYEQDSLNAGAYPIGQSPYPVNRFLYDLIYF